MIHDSFHWQGNNDVTMDMNKSDDDLDIANSVAKYLESQITYRQ